MYVCVYIYIYIYICTWTSARGESAKGQRGGEAASSRSFDPRFPMSCGQVAQCSWRGTRRGRIAGGAGISIRSKVGLRIEPGGGARSAARQRCIHIYIYIYIYLSLSLSIYIYIYIYIYISLSLYIYIYIYNM